MLLSIYTINLFTLVKLVWLVKVWVDIDLVLTQKLITIIPWYIIL